MYLRYNPLQINFPADLHLRGSLSKILRLNSVGKKKSSL